MKLLWRPLILCLVLSWSSSGHGKPIALPEEKTIQGIISRFSEDFLRKFRKKLTDMQKTYQLSMVSQTAIFTDPSSSSRCSTKIEMGSPVLSISKSTTKKLNEISDSITYSPCGKDNFFREVITRRGPNLQDLSLQQVLDVERLLFINSDQDAFSYKLIDSYGQPLVSFTAITNKNGNIYLTMKYLSQSVLEIEQKKAAGSSFTTVSILRNPMEINYISGGSAIRSNFSGTTNLIVRETDYGLLYHMGQNGKTVSQSEWNSEFNASIASTASDYGASAFFDLLLTSFPESLTVVQTIASNKLINELIEGLNIIRSGNIDAKKLEQILSLQLEAAQKGLLKDDRPQ